MCVCVSVSYLAISSLAFIYQREKRGLVSSDAESILRLLLLCFRLNLFNPSEAASSKNCLEKGWDLLMLTATKTHMYTFKPTCCLIQVQHLLCIILFGCWSSCIHYLDTFVLFKLLAGNWPKECKWCPWAGKVCVVRAEPFTGTNNKRFIQNTQALFTPYPAGFVSLSECATNVALLFM